VTEIRESIVDMKAKIESKADSSLYTGASFKSALDAGKVDPSMLSSTLGTMDISAKKLAMKCVMDSSAMVKEMEEQKEMIDAYDWAQWEKKGLDAATIAEVKAVMAAGVDAEKGMLGDTKGAFEAMEKEISAAFKGPGGFLELAAGEEKAAAAGMAKCLADMEKLELDAVGIRDVTIAEILEREPELRAEIEEEIKNNNWGY